jgi:hypothetical protein|tara:strand:- start:15562 stop:16776 length:1215 start_codon:yes stop_codon:yes gene_type:complete
MNIVLYAGDKKYHSVLEPIANELKKTSYNFIFYYTKSTQLLYPTHPQHISNFEYDGQIEKEDPQNSFSLGIQLPFKPKILIIARERWQPEQSIIQEFKEKWGCIVCCVEVSSHLSNNIENRLEMLSRYNPPQNQIDYYFEHSEWAKQRRIDCLDNSFKNKIIVVGNTRNFKTNQLEYLKEKYKINSKKKQILFWGVINTTRKITFDALKTLKEKTKDTHQIFYKCYPGEPFNEKFHNDFNPFCIEGVEVIYDENDIYGMAEICDTHIASASSVFNFAFIHNKKIINLDSICKANEKMNDIDTFIQEKNNGVEDSAKFWMRVWKLNTIDEFKQLIDISRIQKFKTSNKEYITKVKENTIDFDWDCNFLNYPKKDYTNLIKYFDEYKFDNNSSERILNFLKTKYEN